MEMGQAAAALLTATLLFVSPTFAATKPGNTTNQSFNKAKKILLQEVYPDYRLTFYCGSEFDGQSKIVAHTGGYQPRKGRGAG
jgi:deoxyribonuclease I